MANKKVKVKSLNRNFATVGSEKEVSEDEATALGAMNAAERVDEKQGQLDLEPQKPEPLPRGRGERRDMRAKKGMTS